MIKVKRYEVIHSKYHQLPKGTVVILTHYPKREKYFKWEGQWDGPWYWGTLLTEFPDEGLTRIHDKVCLRRIRK